MKTSYENFGLDVMSKVFVKDVGTNTLYIGYLNSKKGVIGDITLPYWMVQRITFTAGFADPLTIAWVRDSNGNIANDQIFSNYAALIYK